MLGYVTLWPASSRNTSVWLASPVVVIVNTLPACITCEQYDQTNNFFCLVCYFVYNNRIPCHVVLTDPAWQWWCTVVCWASLEKVCSLSEYWGRCWCTTTTSFGSGTVIVIIDWNSKLWCHNGNSLLDIVYAVMPSYIFNVFLPLRSLS